MERARRGDPVKITCCCCFWPHASVCVHPPCPVASESARSRMCCEPRGGHNCRAATICTSSQIAGRTATRDRPDPCPPISSSRPSKARLSFLSLSLSHSVESTCVQKSTQRWPNEPSSRALQLRAPNLDGVSLLSFHAAPATDIQTSFRLLNCSSTVRLLRAQISRSSSFRRSPPPSSVPRCTRSLR